MVHCADFLLALSAWFKNYVSDKSKVLTRLHLLVAPWIDKLQDERKAGKDDVLNSGHKLMSDLQGVTMSHGKVA